MKATQWVLLLVLSGSLALAGCGPASEPKGTAPKGGGEQKAPADKTYPIKGKVVEVKPAVPSVRLNHQDIPDLMKGMEMDFDAESAKILEGLRPGDQVHGHLKVRGGRYVIVHLEKH